MAGKSGNDQLRTLLCSGWRKAICAEKEKVEEQRVMAWLAASTACIVFLFKSRTCPAVPQQVSAYISLAGTVT